MTDDFERLRRQAAHLTAERDRLRRALGQIADGCEQPRSAAARALWGLPKEWTVEEEQDG